LDTSHPNTIFELESGDPWVFFEVKRGPQTKQKVEETLFHAIELLCSI